MTSHDDSKERTERGSWRTLNISFDAAVARLPAALQQEGFGIITQIDLQQTFKLKLGKEFGRYSIFGACKPSFALQALESDPQLGLLLPCNIVLFEKPDRTVALGVIDPMRQLGATDGPLAELARSVGDSLARVSETLASPLP
jgi:uncharacterized protein (DUF302 family)